ncbi:MAG: N-acetylmuramoyl-L-alanine amidase [Nitrospirota bacterium]|nr:N-acetylmuramoyl-L-alanine amidase [Nitrospirota bacterium]
MIFCVLMLCCFSAAFAAEKGVTVKGIRFFSYPDFTRVVFEIDAAAPYVLTRSGDGRTLSFSSYGGPFAVSAAQLPVINDGVVKQLENRQDGDRRTIAIVLAQGAGEAKDFVLRGPDRIVVDILRGTPAVTAVGAVPVVVIDAGHGGQQNGLVTGQGVEKSATLEMALAVRRILRGAAVKMKVLLTRDSDLALSLDERAAAANAGEATVFVSLHMGQGTEARVLLLDPDEGQAVTLGGGPADFMGFDAVSEQQQMLWGSQQARHAPESGRLGRAIIRSLSLREEAEPDQAPLALLRPVDAAAVLVETGFGMDRAAAAKRIAQGIERYVHEKR